MKPATTGQSAPDLITPRPTFVGRLDKPRELPPLEWSDKGLARVIEDIQLFEGRHVRSFYVARGVRL